MSDEFYNKTLLTDSSLQKQYFKQMLDSLSPASHKHSSTFSPAKGHVSQNLSSLMVYDEDEHVLFVNTEVFTKSYFEFHTIFCSSFLQHSRLQLLPKENHQA